MAAALLAGGGLSAGPVLAQEVSIGVAAPTSGPSAVLGAQVMAGARTAVAGHAGFAIVEADTACSAEGGRLAAARFVGAGVRVATGFLCTEALEAALPVLSAAGIPVVTSGVRAARLTDRRGKTGALLFRLAPRSDAQAEALAVDIAARWRDVPFGLVDDGSVEGRGLSDAVRARLENLGSKPALIDTYRPADDKQFGLVRRIAASGVTRVLIAGERPDTAVIARDAEESGLSLEILGGEALLDEAGSVPLPAGIRAVAPLFRYSPHLGSAGPNPPETREGYFGPSLAATEIAVEAVGQADRGRRSLADVLGSTRFATALGAVRFDGKGDSDLSLFRSLRFDGSEFRPETDG